MKKSLFVSLLVMGVVALSTSVRADDVAEGKALFDAKGCAACHAVAPGASGAGPNLVGVGARRGSADAIASQIVKPVNTGPVPMPEGLADDKEAKKIAAYLMTLK